MNKFMSKDYMTTVAVAYQLADSILILYVELQAAGIWKVVFNASE